MSCHQESLVKRVYIVLLLIDLKCSEEFLGLPTALNYRLDVSANSAINFGQGRFLVIFMQAISGYFDSGGGCLLKNPLHFHLSYAMLHCCIAGLQACSN
jgi:hypothetical protein